MKTLINKLNEPVVIRLTNGKDLRLSPREQVKIPSSLIPSDLPKGIIKK